MRAAPRQSVFRNGLPGPPPLEGPGNPLRNTLCGACLRRCLAGSTVLCAGAGYRVLPAYGGNRRAQAHAGRVLEFSVRCSCIGAAEGEILTWFCSPEVVLLPQSGVGLRSKVVLFPKVAKVVLLPDVVLLKLCRCCHRTWCSSTQLTAGVVPQSGVVPSARKWCSPKWWCSQKWCCPP